MKHLPAMAAALALGFFSHAHVQASPELAKAKACLNCHALDKAILGPSYQDVANKYRGQKEAATLLARKILAGGGGVWSMPMGPMPAQRGNVSEAQAQQLAQWILSLK